MRVKGLSLPARVEVTKKYATAYREATKQNKSRILDQVVDVTGWNRDHARQQLRRRLTQPKGRATATVAVIDRRRTKPRKYSYDAIKVLQVVWATSGGSCGKYLVESMSTWLDAMEAEGSLVFDQDRYSHEVRTELTSMSAATIDRYLAPARAKDPLRGKSSTRPGNLLRNSISIRKAGDEVETEPGFFEVDTVAHCGPTLKGEFARTVNYTDMHTGWVFTRAIRNNARVHMLSIFDQFITQIPFQVTGIDCDNGSEFINHDLIGWAGDRDIYFTRSRPYKKNDQATMESKNNHLVRRYGFYHRYDTPTELELLNQLWPLVNDRLNFFNPTKKPTGYTTDTIGRRKRLYDTPRTPYQRLCDAGILNPAQHQELAAYKATLKPAAMAN
ncbi:MAG: DDE-type integrase/transposase/recombinase [Propionibacteriaceae bacterium]